MKLHLQDGLGSVRAVADDSAALTQTLDFDPYGVPQGSYGTGFGFTGEYTDANDLLYLRARYYAPGMGVFTGLDPMEGKSCTPMSLNGYSWVEGRVVNATDPTGMSPWADCRTKCSYSGPYINGQLLDETLWRQCIDDCEASKPSLPSDPRTICNNLNGGACGGGYYQQAESDPCEGITDGTIYAQCRFMQEYTSNSSITIFFGGSHGGQPDEQGNPTTANSPGPDPARQTPVWIENTVVFPYIGTSYQSDGVTVNVTAKQNQANSVAGYENHDIDAIGYSAGADSALIFADSFQQNDVGTGRITGLALLEGTMSGGMSGGLRLESEWRAMLDRLLIDGVNIYILNDGGNDVGEWPQVASYTPPSGATGTYCYDPRPDQPHWDGALSGQVGSGTNNSAEYRDFVMGWLNNPTPCN